MLLVNISSAVYDVVTAIIRNNVSERESNTSVFISQPSILHGLTAASSRQPTFMRMHHDDQKSGDAGAKSRTL